MGIVALPHHYRLSPRSRLTDPTQFPPPPAPADGHHGAPWQPQEAASCAATRRLEPAGQAAGQGSQGGGAAAVCGGARWQRAGKWLVLCVVCAVLCAVLRAMPCCAMLCYAMLCCAAPCFSAVLHLAACTCPPCVRCKRTQPCKRTQHCKRTKPCKRTRPCKLTQQPGPPGHC